MSKCKGIGRPKKTSCQATVLGKIMEKNIRAYRMAIRK